MFTKTTTNQTLLSAGVSLITVLMAAAPAAAQHNRSFGSADGNNRANAHANANGQSQSGRPVHTASSNQPTHTSSHTMPAGGVPSSMTSHNMPQQTGVSSGSRRGPSNVPTDVNNGSFSNNGWNRNQTSTTATSHSRPTGGVPSSMTSHNVPQQTGGDSSWRRGPSNVPTDVNNGSFSNNGWSRDRKPTTVTNITNTTTYVDGGRNRSHEGPINRFRDRFIPEQRFHSFFGRNHEFRVNREVIYGGHRRFRFGGVSFAMAQAWPTGWQATDAVYVDYVGGAYMLCNRRIPGLRIPVNVDECESCGMPAAEPAPVTCDSCNAPEVAPTLTRGQSIAEVVSILGNPAQALNLGAKQIYLYPNMKVVFIRGRMVEAI